MSARINRFFFIFFCSFWIKAVGVDDSRFDSKCCYNEERYDILLNVLKCSINTKNLLSCSNYNIKITIIYGHQYLQTTDHNKLNSLHLFTISFVSYNSIIHNIDKNLLNSISDIIMVCYINHFVSILQFCHCEFVYAAKG